MRITGTIKCETMEEEVSEINPEEKENNSRKPEALGLPELHWTQGACSKNPNLYQPENA